MSIRDELLEFRNSTKKSSKQQIQEQSVFSNLPGVQPDKMDYRKPIPNPEILPDCFTALLKSKTTMISFNNHSLQNGTSKRINGVDIVYDPNSPSDELGITIMKDGKPFCFVGK
jgi:hypothetical protein